MGLKNPTKQLRLHFCKAVEPYLTIQCCSLQIEQLIVKRLLRSTKGIFYVIKQGRLVDTVVFRFLKQNLGWESFQIRDFKSIENLLSLAFFLVGYLKELQEELEKCLLATFLCKRAFSKGKVSLFSFWKVYNNWYIFNKLANGWLKKI